MYSRLKRELVIVINRKKKYKLIRLMVTLGLIFSQLAPPFGTLMALSGHSRSKSPVTEVKADNVSTLKTGSFKLKKFDEDGKTPIKDVTFQLTSETNPSNYKIEQITSGAGDASFANIPPGTYLLKEVAPPSGYQVMADYYRITVSPDGYTQYTYVKVGTTTSSPTTSLPSTSGGGTGGTVFRTSKTSGVVTVTDYNFTTKNKAQGNTDYTTLWATSGEFFDMSFKLKVNEGTQAGDSFTIKLSDYLSPNGIREKFISAPPLMLDKKVVATGIYDESTNSYIYTFNDLINHKQNAEITVNYTFSPEAKKVDRDWYVNTYNITNIIDGQKQDSGNFTIDYGQGQYMTGTLNSGLRLRNNITYLNRTTGEVEYTIYLNNGASPRDKDFTVKNPVTGRHFLNLEDKSASVAFTQKNITVYRVPLSQKTSKMPYSMSGETDGLESIPFDYSSKGITFTKESFHDNETNSNTAGLLIKIKAYITADNKRSADVSLSAGWTYTNLIRSRSDAKASAFELGNTSSGVANNIEPTVTIRNYKIKKGSIVFTKQDVETKMTLSGVAFRLEKKEENDWQIVEKYKDVQTGTEGKLILSDLDPGEYQLIETKPLDGYLVSSGPVVTFTITDQGTEGTVKPSDKIIPNTKPGKQKIKVIKKDEQSRVPLAGAKFQLESNKGVVLTGETDGKGEYTFTNLPFGDYILTEIAAPKGYILDKTPRSIAIGDTVDKEPEPTVVEAATPRTVRSVSPSATVSDKDVSRNILVKKVEFTTTNGQTPLQVKPNQGENLIARSEFELKKEIDIKKGDYFAVKLSDNIDPFGVSTGETTTFNITGPYGTLAVGKYDSKSRSIIYTFTDYVEKYEVSNFSTILPYFIDRYAVTRDADINISTSVGSQTNTARVRVLYTPYYGATDSYSPVNIGSMITKLDEKNGTFTNYIYINPMQQFIRNGKLTFQGGGSAIIDNETQVTLFKVNNSTDMPPSWGITDSTLRVENDILVNKKQGEISVDFENILEARNSFIMKVVGKIASSGTSVRTSATLSQKYDNTYGYYSTNGRWIPKGPYSEYYRYDTTAILHSGDSNVDGAIRISVTNRKNSVAFTKTNGLEKPLEATFELRRLNSNKTFTSVKTTKSTKDTGKFSFEGMESGSYEVWETQSPEGYLKPDKAVATFKVDKDGTIKDLTPDNGKIINYPNTAKIIFTKILASEKEELSPATKEKSATFSLWRLKEESLKETNTVSQAYDEQYYEPVMENNSVRTVTSDSSGNVLFDKLSPGFYAIKEEKAPDGYVKQQGIVRIFQVDSSGKVIKYQYFKDKSIAGKLTEITDLETEQLKQFNEIINKKFVFPMTGGQGIALLMIIGGTMMGIAYFGHRRKQRLND
ncbi:TPA: fibrinogen-binding adhesin SdrG C-terminal domain-containing protein [Streptococcus pyogenes]|uniref:LPXTG cell wall anchor domain-containing protein n=1 Tax=Streptococcus pyogenes TaxID=1314 RepID=A0A660A6I3_STRPY|nr:fibronectin-binding protein [Streptococcus pyogenes]HER4525969.1 fibrinogen-binding adhesin SdrG C-terminal domain-containing protein [Streptococcus pyogenes NGAS758]HER4529949.1 fibrinogen-binding adhesin SdrG C-terminal domain-containing protein [Streptococcus pyogenes NGAS746]HER4530771.1 fibrinogen-binding adhesin SdrG C-terminal domain-containing protein [Streptococcus pyogenes NGAS759]HER4534671.1 fibrinogen-binding adhesin SdrG C-terminal domain-containing protein [Streptococcus pyoge